MSRRPISPSRRPGFVEWIEHFGLMRMTVAQRALALVCFDDWEPRSLPADERRVARELFGDVATISPLARSTIAWVKGARTGGTWLGSAYAVHAARTVDLTRLARGEAGYCLTVSPDLRLSRIATRYQLGVLDAAGFTPWVTAKGADGFTLRRPDGREVVFQSLPASHAGSALRGRSLVNVHFSEAAFFRDENFVVSDVELFRAVAPRILPGAKVFLESTPWSRSGLLYELWRENIGKPTTATVALCPTPLMRAGDPHVADILRREEVRDPENYAREFLAQFVDSVSALLAGADVDACVDRGVRERPPRPDVIYGASVDIGLRSDSSVVCAFHVEEKDRGPGFPTLRMLVIDAVRILKPKPLQRVSLDDVEAALAGVALRYRVVKVAGDMHYSDAIAPRLRTRGIGFEEVSMAPTSQEVRAHTLASLVSSHAIRLLDDETLISELKDLRVERRSGGIVSVGASARKHDDVADCVLLAAEAMQRLPACGGDAGRIEFRPGSLVWGEGGLSANGGQWVKVDESGRESPACTPPWADGADLEYEELKAQGIFTPESSAYFMARDGGLNVRIGGND